MKTLLFWCLIVLFVGAPFYFLYWNLFRVALIERLRYRLFKVRDDLRLLVINGEVNEKDKAFPLVEAFCNRAIIRVADADLPTILSSKLDQQSRLEVERDLETIFASSPEVRRLFHEIFLLIFGCAAANSPGVLLLISPGVVFLITALWFNKVRNWLYELAKTGLANIVLKPIKC